MLPTVSVVNGLGLLCEVIYSMHLKSCSASGDYAVVSLPGVQVVITARFKIITITIFISLNYKNLECSID